MSAISSQVLPYQKSSLKTLSKLKQNKAKMTYVVRQFIKQIPL